MHRDSFLGTEFFEVAGILVESQHGVRGRRGLDAIAKDCLQIRVKVLVEVLIEDELKGLRSLMIGR